MSCCSSSAAVIRGLRLLDEELLRSGYFGAETRTVFESRVRPLKLSHHEGMTTQLRAVNEWEWERGYQRACWEGERVREIPIGGEP